MLDAFHDGGWGMYPTLISGLVMILASIRFAACSDRRWAHLGVMVGLTFVIGLLGFLTGLIRTLQAAAGQHDQAALVARGTAESLLNVALALVLIILAGITLLVGLYRSRRAAHDLTAS